MVAPNLENGLQPNWIRRRRNPTTTVSSARRVQGGRAAKEHEERSLRGNILVRTFPATFADPGKNAGNCLRKSKGLPAIPRFRSRPTKQPDRTSKEPRWPPGNIGQKRGGHERRRGCVWSRCWPGAAAYDRGFHAALRKAFVADGSPDKLGECRRRYFSHYVPILDFVHADGYVYAAAMTSGRNANEGWSAYRDWSQWLWKGEVRRLLDALEKRQQELGVPEPKETGTPRAQVANSLAYLTNQRERMKYDQYRKQGLPITSSPIESTVKQINRRIKGTEKFWDEGADPMLHLVADRLSQTNAVTKFWSRRLDRLIQSSSYHQAT